MNAKIVFHATSAAKLLFVFHEPFACVLTDRHFVYRYTRMHLAGTPPTVSDGCGPPLRTLFCHDKKVYAPGDGKIRQNRFEKSMIVPPSLSSHPAAKAVIVEIKFGMMVLVVMNYQFCLRLRVGGGQIAKRYYCSTKKESEKSIEKK